MSSCTTSIGMDMAIDIGIDMGKSMSFGNFISFSKLWRFNICFRKLPAALNVLWHMSHGKIFFSEKCLSRCSSSFSVVANDFWHMLHSNGFSTWTWEVNMDAWSLHSTGHNNRVASFHTLAMWVRKLLANVNFFKQSLHWCCLSLECVVWWIFNPVGVANFLEQILQMHSSPAEILSEWIGFSAAVESG